MIASMRAELVRLLRWPVTWSVAGVWLVLNLTFSYLITGFSYRSAVAGGDDRLAQALLADMSPAELPATLVAGMPLFGGAIVLILGALATGNGYGWGTWKTVLTQAPRRLSALGGTVAALAVIVAGLVAVTFALDLVAGVVVMALTSSPIAWPGVGEALPALGAGLLIMTTWTVGGALLGVLARGPALAVGLGVVWVLAVENLLRGAAQLLSGLAVVTDLLPGTAAGSLAAALGAAGTGDPSGTPGVAAVLDAGPAAALLAVYALAAVAAMAVTFHRRDV